MWLIRFDMSSAARAQFRDSVRQLVAMNHNLLTLVRADQRIYMSVCRHQHVLRLTAYIDDDDAGAQLNKSIAVGVINGALMFHKERTLLLLHKCLLKVLYVLCVHC